MIVNSLMTNHCKLNFAPVVWKIFVEGPDRSIQIMNILRMLVRLLSCLHQPHAKRAQIKESAL